MLEFIKNFFSRGSMPSLTSREPVNVPGPVVERSRIIEGSVTPSFLKPDDALERIVNRLYALDAKICDAESLDRDLVRDLRESFKAEKLPELTQVTQFLAVQTLQQLDRMSDCQLTGKNFVLGAVDPTVLLKASSMNAFVKALTLEYPDYQGLVAEFDTTAIVGAHFDGKVFDQAALDALFAPRASSVGAESSGRNRFDLLRIITQTFDEVGEPVSFGRLKFLNPYIPGIVNCRADHRCAIVRRIFADEYPFNRNNQANWLSEIATLMG